LFPAEATQMMPASRAATMALESASEGVGVSKLALMILAPFVCAYSTQAITVESLPVPLFKHLTAIICTRHATPHTPLPLLPRAPSTPATIVPWLPVSSLGSFVPVKAL
jgi:hypothetical protein